LANEASPWRPAFDLDNTGAPALVWTGTDGRLNHLGSFDGTLSGLLDAREFKRTFDDKASNGAMLCWFEPGSPQPGRKNMYIAWAGTDGANKLNFGDLSRGYVAVYGC
jgi:hypothetical protein